MSHFNHSFIDYRYANATAASRSVPNIVHFVWIPAEKNKTWQLEFHQYVSLLSVHKLLKPDWIYLHTESSPSGRYWDVIKTFPELKLRRLNSTKYIGLNKQKPQFDNQVSDWERVRILKEEGGIYLDTDVIVLRPFDELRNYAMTLGEEMKGVICNAVIIAKPGAPFLDTWLESFEKDFRPSQRVYNAVLVSFHNNIHVY